MSALFIGARERALIVTAIERARDKALPLTVVRKLAFAADKPTMTLADRPAGFKRPQAEIVELPVGYRANISFEEQPAGLCRHLSVSINRPGFLPSHEAFVMIALAFGFTAEAPGQVWIEEFRPGQSAVNMVQRDEPTGC
jgi:hypothetical protein